nr:MAG TPA: hypothetical protein [Caudoviricetes sp.]
MCFLRPVWALRINLRYLLFKNSRMIEGSNKLTIFIGNSKITQKENKHGKFRK